jgi:hypothetical protein
MQTRPRRRVRSIVLSGCGVIAAVGLTAAPAHAASTSTTTPPDTSACSAPLLSQPLLSAKDSNWYTMVPGESPDSFDGAGWTLTGGASIKRTTLADGTSGSVLDLPSGSTAVSPTVCVQLGFQTVRTEVRDLVGAEGVQFYVSYAGTSTWDTPRNTGQVHGQQTNWTLSDPVNVQPSNTTGWQLVRFVLIPGGKTSDFQIYNFWLDPRMCH